MPNLNEKTFRLSSCSTKDAIYIFSCIDNYIEKLRNPGALIIETMYQWEQIKLSEKFYGYTSWIQTLNSKELIILSGYSSSLEEVRIFNIETLAVTKKLDISEREINIKTNVAIISKDIIIYGENENK